MMKLSTALIGLFLSGTGWNKASASSLRGDQEERFLQVTNPASCPEPVGADDVCGMQVHPVRCEERNFRRRDRNLRAVVTDRTAWTHSDDQYRGMAWDPRAEPAEEPHPNADVHEMYTHSDDQYRSVVWEPRRSQPAGPVQAAREPETYASCWYRNRCYAIMAGYPVHTSTVCAKDFVRTNPP